MRGPTGGSPTSATLRLGPPFHPLRAAGAESVIEVADVRRVDGEYVALVWITDDDASAVVDALTERESVNGADALSTAGESRLVRLELAANTAVTAAYEALVEHDVLLSACTGTAEGWGVRLTAPSHGALATVYDRWLSLGVDLDIVSVGSEATGFSPTDGLTDSQREALLRAAETGYFSVPRQTTLAEVAERLGISDQAVSERVRRGTRRLVRENVSADGGAGAPSSERGPSRSEGDGDGYAPEE